MNTVQRTYTARLFPTKEQAEKLRQLSQVRCKLYNMLIEIENNAFDKGKIITEYDLDAMLPALKKENPELKLLNSKAAQRVCKEIYASYKSFFRLIKKDKTAKPPYKLTDTETFHTVVYNQSGWAFKDDKVKLNGITLHYKIKDGIDITKLNVKEVKLKFINGKFLLDLTSNIDVDVPERLVIENKVLAIDLGVKTLATCVDNTGKVLIIPNKAAKIRKYFKREMKKVKEKMEKKQKGSRAWTKLNKTKKRLQHRSNMQVKDTLHIQSKKLADMNYKTIVVGDIKVKKLTSREGVNAEKKNLRKSFYKTAIKRFVDLLSYKCTDRGNEVETISERWTTQTNCLTGKLFKQKVDLSDRELWLNDNTLIDRDLNSAINIMRRYEHNHLALVTMPLDVSNVVASNNLALEKTNLSLLKRKHATSVV